MTPARLNRTRTDAIDIRPARGSPMAPPAARRRTRTGSTCTSWARATRRGRRRCSSRPREERVDRVPRREPREEHVQPDRADRRPAEDRHAVQHAGTAAHGEAKREALDLHDSVTGETTGVESGGLFIFIGALAQTSWLPPDIALDRRGYVATRSEAREACEWPLERRRAGAGPASRDSPRAGLRARARRAGVGEPGPGGCAGGPRPGAASGDRGGGLVRRQRGARKRGKARRGAVGQRPCGRG